MMMVVIVVQIGCCGQVGLAVHPNRAHCAQRLDNLGDVLNQVVYVLLGVLLAQGQTQRAVRDLVGP